MEASAREGSFFLPTPPRKKQNKTKGESLLPADVFLNGGCEEAPSYHPLSGLSGLTCCDRQDMVLVLRRKTLQTYIDPKGQRVEPIDFKESLKRCPYIHLDASTTHCDEAVKITSGDEITVASTEHKGRKSQGSVVGQFFCEGVHTWHACVSDLNLVTVGAVSAVGINQLACGDGSLLNFVASLSQSPVGDSLKVSYVGEDGQPHTLPPVSNPGSAKCTPLKESKKSGQFRSPLSLRIPLAHSRGLQYSAGHSVDGVDVYPPTDSDEDSIDSGEWGRASLPEGHVSSRTAVTVKLFMEFFTGTVAFYVNNELVGRVVLGTLIGGHSFGIWMKSGAVVKVFNPALTSPHAKAKPTSPRAQKADLLLKVHIAGNPLIAWDQINGISSSTSFYHPFACCTGLMGEQPIVYVTDRHLLRVTLYVDHAAHNAPGTHSRGAWATLNQYRQTIAIRLSLNGVLLTPADVFLTGICSCESGRRLFICDAWSQRVLEVHPDPCTDIWPATVIMQRGTTTAERAAIRRLITYSWIESTLSAGHSSAGPSPLSPLKSAATTRGGVATLPSSQLLSQGIGIWGICYMMGFLFITDSLRHCVLSSEVGDWFDGEAEEAGGAVVQSRKKWDEGIVVGQPGVPGCRDGWGLQSRLKLPTGIACDPQSHALFVCDTANNRVVKVLLKPTSKGFEGCLSNLKICDSRTSKPITLWRPSSLSLKSNTATKVLVCGEQFSETVYQIALVAGSTAKEERSFFASPFERIIELLQGLKQTEIGRGEQGYILDEVLGALSQGQGIFTAKMVAKGDIDGQLSAWLQRGFATKTDERLPSKTDSMSVDTPAFQYRRPSINDYKSIQFAIQSSSQITLQSIVYMKNFNNFDFDIFSTSESLRQRHLRKMARAVKVATQPDKISSFADLLDHSMQKHGGSEVQVSLTNLGAHSVFIQVMLQVISQYQFMDRLGLKVSKVMAILRVVEVGYQDNPYHNSLHAADVVQTIQAVVCATRLDEICSALELFSLFFAAAIHDYDHPGVSNQFLTSTRDSLAIRYNDRSILENYHVSQVFKLIRQHPACDFLADLSTADQMNFRELVITQVLTTDMKQHFSLLSHFKTRYGPNKPSHPSEDDRLLLFKFILHSADISNPVKPKTTYLNWADRVMSEFREQGETEKLHELPYSPFCEPDQNVAKCQKGFIDFIVRPQYQALVGAFPILSCLLVNLEENYAYWDALSQ